jgi:hypothetical protein
MVFNDEGQRLYQNRGGLKGVKENPGGMETIRAPRKVPASGNEKSTNSPIPNCKNEWEERPQFVS